MLATQNLLDKYRSISIERVNEFLTRKSIEHKCTELRKIVFRLEDWSWDLYIDDNYVNIELVFTITDENSIDNPTNTQIAEKACIEVTNRIKVLKAYYTLQKFIDKENGNKLVKFHLLQFEFESFCYNMYDFRKLFYEAIRIILAGNREYHKLYEEIESTLPVAPVGFKSGDSEDVNEELQPSDRHHIGFV